MAKVIASPSRYIQGAGELKKIGEYAKKLGNHAFVVISQSGMKRVGDLAKSSFEAAGVTVDFEIFNGECSKIEIERLRKLFQSHSCDVIIGIGGGKILDTSKAMAYYEKVPVAICPTIAATDAPCSALSVIYTQDGVFEEYLFLPENPNLVLVDTEIVSKAPVRLLVSGMGDALATLFEAKAAMAKGADNCVGGKGTQAALALAQLCYDTLLSQGLKAKLAVEAGACTASVEKIIEANTYLSGIGFESGGLAGAHAIHNGLTVIHECHHLYHGEKVAFGTLVQLILEDYSAEEIDEVVTFCMSVGLPVTLEDMGIQHPDPSKLMEVAQLACAEGDTMGNLPIAVTPQDVYSAILGADAIGRHYKEA